MGIYKSKVKPSVGDYVELIVSCEDGEQIVISSAPCAQAKVSDASFIEGALRIAPKGFGFVEDTFVPPFLIADITTDTMVSALQVMSWDKIKSRYGWKAIKLTRLNTD